ncbi:hypothetical protein E2C01_098572 [Portunus trituberculatus]|uniref:Uncharacterized protein n=1 Tax=Portunus trituberculatus TaxID=210409 RepID=A0A5B7K3B1_PORTR|nr:hypothetical protein [Portunus trituberculatus]
MQAATHTLYVIKGVASRHNRGRQRLTARVALRLPTHQGRGLTCGLTPDLTQTPASPRFPHSKYGWWRGSDTAVLLVRHDDRREWCGGDVVHVERRSSPAHPYTVWQDQVTEVRYL